MATVTALRSSFNLNIREFLIKSCKKLNHLKYYHLKTRSYSQGSAEVYDVVVVGGGIVGMASAREISLRHKTARMAVVEKESRLAFHQSGHNSGVIHAGIYYKPKSLKAKLCVEGLNLTYSYCDANNIPYKKCGKLIVATNPVEVERLNDLYQRGIQNNVKDMRMIDKDEIKKIEPFCKGLKAIHSPHTGIVDWSLVTHHYGTDFQKAGGKIFLNFNVTGFREASAADSHGAEYPVVVQSGNKDWAVSDKGYVFKKIRMKVAEELGQQNNHM